MTIQSVSNSPHVIVDGYLTSSDSEDFLTEEQAEEQSGGSVNGRTYSCFGRQFNSEQMQCIHRVIGTAIYIPFLIGLTISYVVVPLDKNVYLGCVFGSFTVLMLSNFAALKLYPLIP